MRSLLPLLAVPVVAIVVVLGVVLLLDGLRSPVRVFLAAFAVIVPVGSSIAVPIGLPAPFNTLSTLFGALAAAGIILHLAASGRALPRIPSAVAVWGVFLGLAALTLLWSINPDESVDFLLVFFGLVALYGASSLLPVSRGDLRYLETAIVLGGVVAACYGLYLLASGQLPLFGGETPRFAAGDEGGPNIMAAALLMPLAIAAGRGLRGSTGRGRPASLGAAVLIATGIALTASRGGLLSMAVVLVALAVNERRRSIIVAAVLIAVLAGALTTAIAPQALTGRLSKEGSSGRAFIWKTGLEACRTYCVTGSGWGTFADAYNLAIGVSPNITGRQLRQKAHNIWLKTAVETGLLGVVLMTLAFGLVLRDVLRLPRENRGAPLAGLLGVLVANVFLSALEFKYLWLALVYVTLAARVYAPGPSRGPEVRMRELAHA